MYKTISTQTVYRVSILTMFNEENSEYSDYSLVEALVEDLKSDSGIAWVIVDKHEDEVQELKRGSSLKTRIKKDNVGKNIMRFSPMGL